MAIVPASSRGGVTGPGSSTSGDLATFGDTTGSVLTDSGLAPGGVAILTPAASTRNVIQPTGAAIIPLIARGFASQSASLFEAQNSAGAALFTVTAPSGGTVTTGIFVALNGVVTSTINTAAYATAIALNTGCIVGTSATNTVKLIARAVAGQSVDVFQVQDSSPAKAMGVNAAGQLSWVAANEQTTVGAFGAASALPVTPTKYLKIVDSAGTVLVIPCYAAA